MNETIQTFDVAAILRRLPDLDLAHLDLARETTAADAAADAFPSGLGPISWADDPCSEPGELG